MNKRNNKLKGCYFSQNDKSQKNRTEKVRIYQSEYTDNNPFDFESSAQSNSRNSNQQNQWQNTYYNSTDRQNNQNLSHMDLSKHNSEENVNRQKNKAYFLKDKSQNNRPGRFRMNQSENSDSNPIDFKLSAQSNSRNSNQQNQWKNKYNSTHRQERNNQTSSDIDLSKHDLREHVERRKDETKKKYFGFKRLEELVSKDIAEIVFVISNNSNGFIDLFKQNKDPDWIFLLIKVSAMVCSTEFNQNKTILLTELTCNTFFNHLKSFILNTPNEKYHKRRNNMNTFFEDCLVVFQTITTLFPKTAVERLKELVVSSNIALNGIQQYCNDIQINETTIVGMKELLQKLNEIKLTEEVKLKEKSAIENIAQYFQPPENFRELTVYPTAADLETGGTFLRPNISKGAYQNVEHYLDVQFRLLREDFVAPLREGIKFYKDMINNQQRKKRINNIRVYNDVIFENVGEFIHDKNGFFINFNRKNKLKINWEMAKRFMYGSLLLFSVNDFNTFFLGVVLDRKIELLKEGKLLVELLEGAAPIYNTSLTMVESEVFFEPYKCTMEALKNINSHNFPMEKYIISAVNEIDYPIYIDTLPEQHYEIDGLGKFDILIDNEWPSKDQLKLDEMQYGAFKAALTQEFTVIQGPPGTGKTFIGLKIMETIINNLYKNNNSFLTKPILVVCYTNHALDQFVEGILNFTNHIVRIGGQSKSEKLQKYSLRNITHMYRRSVTTNTAIGNINDRVKSIMKNIKYFRRCSEVVSYNVGVLELSLLKNGMPKMYHYFFKTTLDLLSWLFQDFEFFEVDPVGFISSVGHELINKKFHSEKLLEVKHNVEDDDDTDMRYEANDPDLEYNHNDIVIYSLTLDDLKSACLELLSQSQELEIQSNSDVNFYNDYEEAKFNFYIMEKIHDYFENMLSLVNVSIDLPRSNQDLKILNMQQRWALYFQWVKNTQQMFGPKIRDYEQKYVHTHKQYSELKELENIEILNRMHVIALTTTGAAQHRIMLEGLASPIVVVEEAAEVLEPHIVSSLTKHCQHLILIGDHKQLRPSNAVYKLAKDFNFDISLFERMVNNDVPCFTLGEQHRMRPEIASLISPTIYPNLKNHIDVHNREHIRGVSKDMFFLNHNEYENEVEEISSKSNEHEAKFLIMFARHLILQGYKAEQITILTTYSGQLFQLRSVRKRHAILQGVRITVVDNYQGEESDIILLSLVRSNEKGNVGFLKTENRVCVALSRAKYGLYIIGNMDNLSKSGDLWKKIRDVLVEQDSYGDELILECAVHSGITTKVSKSEDFNLIMEGGCTMLCKLLLLCGHYCSSICHSYDRDHLEMKCCEPCNKYCENNHPCMKKCFMDCGLCLVPILKQLPCGHELILPCYVDNMTYPCEVQVETVLKDCNHQIPKKCHEKKPICTFKCYDRLDCGHACERNCHKLDDPNHEQYKCTKPCESINKNCSLNHRCKKLCYEDCATCTVKIKKELLCGHTKNDVPCGFKNGDIKCYLPCKRPLVCGHKCQSKCCEPCKPCDKQVKKTIPVCGHSITVECHSAPERKHCTQICERILDCGHICKRLCSKQCDSQKCREIVLQKYSKLACGHSEVWVLCHDRDKEFRMDSQYVLDKCHEPCLQKLNCNDICLGICGECKQGRIHVPCNEICNKVNPCNHTCKSPCKERCPPCNQKCLYSCNHSRCTKICGVPCITCKEKCDWQCPHLKCTRKCGEICNRQPCFKPCPLKLQCGHECIGYCGEPCPPLCRVCQKDEVTTIIFGYEDEPDARFVYLEDCKHSIESNSLEQWMNQNDEEIALKQCPLCKTPILKTLRFMNQVKIVLQDVSVIKRKLYGELSIIQSHQKKIINSLFILNKNFNKEFIGDVNKCVQIKYDWDQFSKPLLASLNYKGRKLTYFSVSTREIESLEFVIELFKSTSKYKERVKGIKDGQMKETIVNHFVWLISVAFKFARQLSNQQKCDINMEMARGARIVSLYEIQSTAQYKMAAGIQTPSALEVKDLVNNMEALLMSCRPYNVNRDEEIQYFTQLIQQKIKGISVITPEERKMIHAAMSVSFYSSERRQGHWCKCPNGHIYCITECGGPMEEAVCPECKVPIGGQNHRHVSGIHVASEMDGAERLQFQPR